MILPTLLPNSSRFKAILVGLATLLLSLIGNASTFVPPSERDELREHLRQTIAQADSFEDRFDAEVWLIDMSGRLARFLPDPVQRLELLRLLHREASAAELDPELV